MPNSIWHVLIPFCCYAGRDEVDNAFTTNSGEKLRRVPLSRYLKMQAAAKGQKTESNVRPCCLPCALHCIAFAVPVYMCRVVIQHSHRRRRTATVLSST